METIKDIRKELEKNIKLTSTEWEQILKREDALKELSNARNMEEVLLASFKLLSCRSKVFGLDQERVANKKKEIRKKERAGYEKKVLETLRANLQQGNTQNVVSKTASDLSLPLWKVASILLDDWDLKKTLKDIINMDFCEYQREVGETVEEARIILSLFMKMGCKDNTEFVKRTKCSHSTLRIADETVENCDKEFYQKYKTYREKKHEEKILKRSENFSIYLKNKKEAQLENLKGITKEEWQGYLSGEKSSCYLSLFSELYDLPMSILKEYFIAEKKNMATFLSLSKEKMQDVLASYKEELENKVSGPISSMHKILKVESYNRKYPERSLPVPEFDFISFYQEGYTLSSLSRILKVTGQQDFKNVLTIFSKRYCSHFCPLTQADIKKYYISGRITLKDETIKFSSKEFDKAIEEISEGGFPFETGVLFQKLKQQKGKEKPAIHQKKVGVKA